MKHIFNVKVLALLLFGLSGCKTDFAEIPTYSVTRQLQAVIEVPAGTNHKIRYQRSTKEFVNDKEAGKDRIIRFLPYPGNYGFIPSTETDHAGSGLGILVIAESVPTGTVTEVIPAAALLLEHGTGDLEVVVVAVPARPSEQLISATDYKSLNSKYPVVKEIIQSWFANYNPTAQTKVVGWKDEKFAEKEIQRWMKL